MKVNKCGTNVSFNGINGIITSINISDNDIKYEISYFIGVEYKQIWLKEYQFIITDNNTITKIGYK